MCQQVCLVGRQNRAKKTQILKPSEIWQGRIVRRIDWDSKGRMVTKNTKKDQFALVDKWLDMLMPEQYRMLWVTIDQALIAPDWDEAAVLISNRIGQPIEILAPFTASVDKRARKYILILHPSARVQARAQIASID
jgi:hypothetical protein